MKLYQDCFSKRGVAFLREGQVETSIFVQNFDINYIEATIQFCCYLTFSVHAGPMFD